MTLMHESRVQWGIAVPARVRLALEDQFGLTHNHKMSSRPLSKRWTWVQLKLGFPSRGKGRDPVKKIEINIGILKVRFFGILHPPPVGKIKVSSP